MQYNYPHSIENGGGETLTFIRKVEDANGGYLEVENFVTPGSGPPMHVHHKQEESLTVVSGKIGVQVLGEEPKFYEAGHTVTFPRGQGHKFWNAGNEPLICKGWVRPIDNIEYFLTEIYRSTKENGGKGPGNFDGAYLLTRYKTEFGLVEVPGFVRKFIFPITIFFGKLSGKHKKFKGAPEPVR
jgi:quercetin dioxygenase-like cupin family protein